MRIKHLLVINLALVALLAGSAPATAEKSMNGQKTIWKFATLAPNGIGWSIHIKDLLLPFVDKQSDGMVRIRVFWGGVIGDEEATLKRMHLGQLNGVGLSGQGVPMAIPEMAVLELPFLFSGYGEVDYVRSKMMPTFDKLAAKQGLFLIALLDQDFDQIYSTKYNMTQLEHFKRSQFYTWYGPLEEAMLSSISQPPVKVDVPEIPSVIRQGQCNAGIGPVVWQVGYQLHSTWRYINPTKIRYSPAIIIQNSTDYDRSPILQDQKQAMLKYRADFTKEFVSRVRADNVRYLKAMAEYGLVISEMDPESLEQFKMKTRPVWNELAGSVFSKEILDEVLANINQHRAQVGKPPVDRHLTAVEN